MNNPPRDIFLGLDLGLRRDPSALIAVERAVTIHRVQNRVTYSWENHDETRFSIVHAERWPLGTPFPDVTRRTAEIARFCTTRSARTVLAMDATGLGIPVVGMMKDEPLGSCLFLPVTITDGSRQHYSNSNYMVPKQDLVAGLSSTLESRCLTFAPGINIHPLIDEMRDFGVRLRPSGSDSYSGKAHDDLVIALCLALWAAGRSPHAPGPLPVPGPTGGNVLL